MHQNGLQRKINRSTVQQPGTKSGHRFAEKTGFKRLLTAYFVFLSVYKGLFCSCFRRVVQDNCFRCPARRNGWLRPGRRHLSASCAARPSSAPPLRDAPPRLDPPVVCSSCAFTCRIQNPDIARAGRVGARGGVAGRGRAGLDANRTVRLGDKPPSYPPKHRRHVA